VVGVGVDVLRASLSDALRMTSLRGKTQGLNKTQPTGLARFGLAGRPTRMIAEEAVDDSDLVADEEAEGQA
jgi:hypothetical protein